MTTFRRLSVASLIATFVLVGIGGLVRATKSGLGCGTDWPHCNGSLAPALENRAVIIEFSHRLAAAAVIILLASLAVLAFRYYRRTRLMWASVGAFGLVMSQAIVGALVVKLELQSVSVVLHLAVAMSLSALLVYLVLATYASQGRLRPEPDSRLGSRAWAVALAVLLLLAVGSYVSSFPDRPPTWPLIDGRLIPDLSSEVFAWHFVHRLLAAAVGVVMFAFGVGVIRRKSEAPLSARFAHVALGTFALEVVIGAANVWTNLNEFVVTLHLICGAVIWGSVVAIAVVAHPGLEQAAVPKALAKRGVILESGG